MNFCKIIISFFLIINSTESYSQVDTIKYYYYKKDGDNVNPKLYAFSLLKQKTNYTFIFKSDTSIVSYPNTIQDTIITSKTFGPYRFKRQGNKILLGTKKGVNWKYQDLYSIQSLSTFLAPDLFSSSIDSYKKECNYLGIKKLALKNGKSERVYIFQEKEGGKGTKIFMQKKFISIETLVPVRIEYYKDTDFTKIISLIEKS